MTTTKTPDDINVIDVISSGSSTEDYPIEISVLLGNGQCYHSFIEPADQWLKPEQENTSSLVHAQEDRSKCKNPKQVCDDLLLLCGQLDMYSDSPIMDNHWLEKLFSAAGTTHRIRCKSIEELIGEAQISAWHDKKVFINDLFDHNELSALDQSNTVKVALSIFFSDQVYSLTDQNLPTAEVAFIN